MSGSFPTRALLVLFLLISAFAAFTVVTRQAAAVLRAGTSAVADAGSADLPDLVGHLGLAAGAVAGQSIRPGLLPAGSPAVTPTDLEPGYRSLGSTATARASRTTAPDSTATSTSAESTTSTAAPTTVPSTTTVPTTTSTAPSTTTTTSTTVPATTTTTVPVTTTTTAPPWNGGVLSEDQAVEIFSLYFVGGDVETALRVARCESSLNPNAYNPAGPGYGGLFQHDANAWPNRAAAAGWGGASIFDPYANSAVAAWLVSQSGWSPWPNC
ncbi:MAG: hypothetical protein OEO77_14590 [Acidimicrobiia bacterium]|nr:hypothetical protein [Acidimicrobiia bacterium]